MKLLREPLILLLLSSLLAGGVFLGMQPPKAMPASAPSTEFSANRALSRLEQLYQENLPHPAGSPHNQLIRDRIQQQLQEIGLTVQIQSLDHCNSKFGLCSPVENILARLPGTGGDPSHALLLTAHYDSVEAGTGAGDDGAGIAALLEIAAMMKAQGGMKHDLVFLFSDAEELGLIGADVFASEHEWFADVALVINLEARGVTGGSTMFETGNGNRSYVRILAQSLDRPIANSLTREVYRRMPNDTDFSVYREQGRSGFNFAFTGGAAVYHSAIDNLQELDAKSLQHHGQNVWALLQVLDQRDLQRIDNDEDAVYIDLFGHKLLHFPQSSATGLALVLSVLMLVFVRISFRNQLSLRQSAWTAGFILLMAPLLFGLAWLISWPLGHWPDLNSMGHPYPWFGRLALVLTAMLAIRLLLNNLCQRATTGSITLVCWLFFAGLAMVLSNKMPAASFLGIVPLVAFMLGSLLDGMLRKRHTQLLFARLFGFLATVYLGCYFFYGLEVVAGFDRSYVLVAPLLLPMVAVLPLLASNVTRPHTSRWDLMLVLLPIGAICIAQPFIPGHNLDRPRGMNLVHRTVVGEDTALWQLETSTSAVDKEYAYRHDFGPVKIDLPGRGPQDIVAKPADSLPHGEVRLVESSKQDDGTLLRRSMQLEVPVDVRQLTLFLPANLVFNTVRVNGKLALQNPAPLPAGRSHRGIVLNRPKAGQVRVEITSSSSNPGSANSLAIPVRTRSSLPESVLQPQLQGWPLDAQAQHQGHRSEVEYLLQPDW